MTHVRGLTVTEICVVAAAVVVLGALGVAVALILTVVAFTTSAFTGSGSLWMGKRKTLAITCGYNYFFFYRCYKLESLTFTYVNVVRAAVVVALTGRVTLTGETAVCSITTATHT